MREKNLFDLKDQVAVVTGGAGVLGQEMVKALSGAGAQVVILGRNQEKGEAFAKTIQSDGGRCIFIQADVTRQSDVSQARQKIHEQFGPVSILINAAGGNMSGATIMPDKTFLDLDVEAFRQVVDLNLLGTVIPSHEFAKDFVAARRGVIVNISSMAASRPITRVTGYAAAKSAIDNFTRWLSVEMSRKFGEGIRVNAIAPGFFITEQNRNLLTNADGSFTPRGEAVLAHTPFGRFGNPDDLSGTLIWLCSDASRFVTGIVVPVDGGFSAFAGV